MRVLYVIDDGIDSSGQAVTLKNWAPIFAALHERGVFLDVVSLRSSILYSAITAGGSGRLVSLAARKRVPLDKCLLLRKTLKTGRYDLIHANEVVPSLLTGLARVGRSDPPVVFHRHHERSRGAHGALSRVAARLSDVTLAVSNAVGKAARDFDRTPQSRIRVIPNGTPALRYVSADELTAMRSDLSIPSGALVVVAVARLRPAKGLHVLVEAADRVAKMVRHEVHLVLVGDGPEAIRLGSQLDEGQDLVGHMVGHDPDVARWYALADVVAVPSFSEPFGLVVIEAMASRRAVVASDIGGPAEIVVHEETGLLVRPGDPRALANGIARLLQEPTLAKRFGEAGYERYRRHYTLDAMIEGWIAAYEGLLARN